MAETTEMKAHEQTYFSMIAWMKWGAVLCLLIAALVIWLIAG